MARPKKTGEGTGTPISLRLTESIQAQLYEAARKLDMPVSELMRLCFRIGVEHFRRIDYDLASCIVAAGQNKPSFSPVSETSDVSAACAATADSTSSSPPSSLPSAPARIAQLPAPPTLGTVVHDGLGNPTPHSLNEPSQSSPAPAETRREVRYPKSPNKKRRNGTED